ncbi:hypothetical protein FRC03_009764 [Tulasnella sp. 419]|nr:hypothetical protein FRC03_009764 [Tulasnella sp. 419]
MDCLKTLTELMDLTQKIKDTFNEVQKQPGVLIGEVLSKELFNTLSQVHDVCSSIYIPHVPDTAVKLKLLQSELNRILTQRQNIKLRRYRTYLSSFIFSDRTNDELAQVHLEIQECQKGLETKYSARIDILNRIYTKLEGRINDAEHNDTRAEELVRVSGINSYRASKLLQECENFSAENELSNLERRYINLKIKILRNHISDDWPRTRRMENTGRYTLVGPSFDVDMHGLMMEDWVNTGNSEGKGEDASVGPSFDATSRIPAVEDEEPSDRILELLRLSNDLRNGGTISRQEAIPLINRLIKNIDQFRLFEEAADLAEWVVDIFLGVVRSGDIEFKEQLVRSQIHYTDLLIAAGLGDCALNVAKANVAMCREEADIEPSQWLPLLAGALRSHAVALHHAGKHDEEMSALVESVEVHGQHAEHADEPTSFHSTDYQSLHLSPALALALDNLSKKFNSTSKYIEAVDASEASLGINQKLAETQSKQSLPSLAASYEGLSTSLIALKRYEDAIAALRKSTNIYLGLAKDQSETFLMEFTRMSKELSDQLIKLDRYQDALEVLEEAIRVNRELFLDNVPGLLKDLAACLVIKATTLCLLSRPEDAFTAATESVGTYRKIIKAASSNVLINLAFSLDVLAWSLHKLGLNAAALSNLDEALQLLSSAMKDIEPNLYKLVRAACLRTQATCLSHLNRGKEAGPVEAEASEIASTLWPDEPNMKAYKMHEYPLHVCQGFYKVDVPKPSTNVSVEKHQKDDWELKAEMEHSDQVLVAHRGHNDIVFEGSSSPW